MVGTPAVDTESPRGPFAAIPNEILDDPDLDIYDCATYAAIKRRDHHGDGWVFELAELAAAARCGLTRLQESLRKLEQCGLIRRVGPARRTARYFALEPGQLSPHDNCDDAQLSPGVNRLSPHDNSVVATRHPYKETKDDTKTSKETTAVAVVGAPPSAAAVTPPSVAVETTSSEGQDDWPAWIDEIVDQIGAAIGLAYVPDDRRGEWRPVIRDQLRGVAPADRARFAGWMNSNGFFTGRAHLVSKKLGEDCGDWLTTGMTESKQHRSAPSGNGHAPAARGAAGGQPTASSLTPEFREARKKRIAAEAAAKMAARAQQTPEAP